jgi:hypothetical protein
MSKALVIRVNELEWERRVFWGVCAGGMGLFFGLKL